jgi:mRNA interferase RelE/StbE
LTDDPWTYAITPPARRDLRRLDRPVKERVVDALDRFVADPRAGDTRKLTGSDEWRLRVGLWRVRFNFDDEARTVIVTRVLPRGRAYDR